MRSTLGLVAAVAVSAAFPWLACSSRSSSTNTTSAGGTGSDAGTSGTGGSAGAGGSGAQTGGGSDGAGGSAGKGGSAGSPNGGSQNAGGSAGTGGQESCGRPRSIWAEWPIPNPPSSGLPNPQSYDTSVPGVVCDQVTRLLWQREVDSTAIPTQDEAVAYCEALELAGYDDWRLPTRIELASLLDHSQTPSLSAEAFPATPQSLFWTSSRYGTQAWAISFQAGDVLPVVTTTLGLVRCVR
jgi:hypothetical protein